MAENATLNGVDIRFEIHREGIPIVYTPGGFWTLEKGWAVAERLSPLGYKVLLWDRPNTAQRLLEIGCGDGRLTWRYADRAANVIAIDPFEMSIVRAKEHTPEELKSRVEFHHIGFDDFAAGSEASTFDVVILSWLL